MPQRVRDMTFDEVSLVDVPANQHARILITKAAGPQEDTVPDNTEIEEVGLDELQVGDVVLDDNDEAIEVTQELLDEIHSLEPADFDEQPEPEPVGKSYADQVVEALSKALGGEPDAEALSKVHSHIAALEKRATQAEEVAKAERDARLEKDYIEKAAGYGLPGVDPADLGPVMKRAAELLPFEDARYLHQVFETTGAATSHLFDEIGKGAGSNSDPFGIVSDVLAGQVDLSKADQRDSMIKAFEEDPDLYLQYEAEQRARRGF